jgi:hypothetical protein
MMMMLDDDDDDQVLDDMTMKTMVHDNRDHSDEKNEGHCHLYCDGYDYCDDVDNDRDDNDDERRL